LDLHGAPTSVARGLYKESEALFRRALDLAEPVFGDDDSDVLALLNNFVVLYKYSGASRKPKHVPPRAVDRRKRFGQRTP
jgi:hypothetical protein